MEYCLKNKWKKITKEYHLHIDWFKAQISIWKIVRHHFSLFILIDSKIFQHSNRQNTHRPHYFERNFQTSKIVPDYLIKLALHNKAIIVKEGQGCRNDMVIMLNSMTYDNIKLLALIFIGRRSHVDCMEYVRPLAFCLENVPSSVWRS